MRLITLIDSDRKGKKYKAVFLKDNGRTKTIHFGNLSYQDYTQHHSKQRRESYLKRHEARENWDVPDTAGSLSAHILWGPSTNIDTNVSLFRKKFNV
jgi:hypothetical protein